MRPSWFDHVTGQPLPAREQLRTRSCVRCAGLLVTEWNHYVQRRRRVDPVIFQNQIGPQPRDVLQLGFTLQQEGVGLVRIVQRPNINIVLPGTEASQLP